MKLKDLIDRTEQDVCVIDGRNGASLILRIQVYCVDVRFWLTDTALEQDIFEIFTDEKYPNCLCVILGDIDD